MIDLEQLDIDVLGRIFHLHRDVSRRAAKREIFDATGVRGAEILDRTLAFIEEHPQRAAIVAHAVALCDARDAWRQRQQRAKDSAGDWFVAENVAQPGWWLIYIGCDNAFVAEIVGDEEECEEGMERYPLDEGQWLTNILWLDERPPGTDELADLMERAREQVRIYDAGCDDEEEKKGRAE